MPTAAENKNPTIMAVSDIGAGQPVKAEIDIENAAPIKIPRDAAAHAEEHGLGQELQQHMQPSGANRHAQTDFARSFCHGDKKNVHNSDTADDKRYGCDGGEKKRHDAAAALRGLGNLAEVSARRNHWWREA